MNEGDLERFQGISYTYLLMLELMSTKMEDIHRLDPWFNSWAYYGKYAHDQDLNFGCETVLYDAGNLLISLRVHPRRLLRTLPNDQVIVLTQPLATPKVAMTQVMDAAANIGAL